LKAVVAVELGDARAVIARKLLTPCAWTQTNFPAVIAASSNHGMEIALLTWKVSAMYFDPDTIALLRATLDHAWASLPRHQQAVTSRSVLAERILRAAARGERDPDRLRAHALSEHADLKIAS
jgi:hypothetical protein